VDKRHVALHVFAPCVYILGREVFGCHGLLIAMQEPGAHLPNEKIGERRDIPRPQGLIGHRDCGSQIPTGWLEASKRGALTGAMDANKRLEEIGICKFPCLRA
jgi:hypothetical protein